MIPLVTARARAFLYHTQNADGGWPFIPGTPSATEPTAIALLALHHLADETARISTWLTAAQHPDGGWGLTAADALSQWHTAWASLALATTEGRACPACQPARTWLLNTASLTLTDPAESAQISRLLRIDPALRGWPWSPGEAAWVEPTALAVLALHAMGAGAGPRVAEGVRYLHDRRCVAGGWNVGNPFMFDTPFEPRAYPTALALLALSAAPGPAGDATVPSGLAALMRQMHLEGDPLSLAWGLLALGAWGERDDEGARRLLAAQGEDGSWRGQPLVTAAALLWLGGGWPG
ncbi:MAG: terpene cyclase/mutase family protein [Ardenticatenaceae bacterium]|nr:terpene cyclase/mutase family protein [Ardenticatenaceae bacterium]